MTDIGFIRQISSGPLLPIHWIVSGTGLEASTSDLLFTTNPALSGQFLRTVAYNGVIWIAAGSHIHTSPDARTWTQRTSGFDGGSCQSVLWDGTRWLAAGYGPSSGTGLLQTSSDGITWSSVSTPGSVSGNQFSGLAYNSALYVLCAAPVLGSVRLQTSPDGTTWTSRTVPLDGVYTATWVGNQWIIGGYHSSTAKCIATSPDGITWTAQTTPFDGSGAITPRVNGLSWNGSVIVGVGADKDLTKAIQTSPDGVTWTYRASNLDTSGGFGVFWDGTRFLASGDRGLVSSADATSWSVVISPLSSLLAVASLPAMYFGSDTGVGSDVTTDGFAFSADSASAAEGVTVTVVLSGSDTATDSESALLPPDMIVTSDWLDEGGNGSKFESVASDANEGPFVVQTVGHSPSADQTCSRMIKWNGLQWLLYVEKSSDNGSNYDGSLYTSTDGVNWTAQSSVFTGTTVGNFNGGNGATGAVWDGAQWVVVGSLSNSGGQKCASSSDGITWTTQGAPTMDFPRAVTYASSLGLYVCVGQKLGGGAQICTSSNLSSWTTRTNTNAQILYDVAWNGLGFVAVGRRISPGANAWVEASSDGINWSPHNHALTSTTARLYGIAWDGGGRWVAVGRSVSAATQTIERSTTIGLSWVASFAGHRSTNGSLSTAPTGMTNQSNIEGATADAAGHDTNGTIFGWADQSVATGETSSGWISATCEIVSSGGSVSRISSAAAEAASVTMPTHATGDLLLIFAFRDGSTTAPSLPGGWTSLTSLGLNSCSGILGYRIATSSSETSGTWTNATNVVVHVYRNAAAGGFNVTGGSSATVTYPGITFNSTWSVSSNNPFTDYARDIIYTGSKFYAIATNSQWASSVDGSTWTNLGTLNAELYALNQIGYKPFSSSDLGSGAEGVPVIT